MNPDARTSASVCSAKPRWKPPGPLSPIFAAVLSSACVPSGTYSNVIEPLAFHGTSLMPDQAPQLAGYVADVDGKVVPEDRALDLSPGCHLVRTPFVFRLPDTLSLNPYQQTMVTGRRFFAVSMRVGHRYTVQVEPWSSAISPDINAYEMDAQGKKTNVFRPMSKEGAVDACSQSLPPALPASGS